MIFLRRHHVGGFLRQCARILYWSYVKPYTFRDYLRQINPELDAATHWGWLTAKFPAHAALAEYCLQANVIVRAAPIVLVVLGGTILELSRFPFHWLFALIYTIGFAVGAAFDTVVPDATRDSVRTSHLRLGIVTILWAVAFIACLQLFRDRFIAALIVLMGYSEGMAVLKICTLLLPFMWLFAVGIGIGVAVGTAYGIALSVAFGVAGGIALGLALGTTFSTQASVSVGLLVGIALGAAFGVTFGLTVAVGAGLVLSFAAGIIGATVADLAVGLAFTAALFTGSVVGAFRLFVWPIEAAWMLILRSRAPGPRAGNSLRYLPTYYSEFIVLPLPYLSTFLVDAYQANKIGACHMMRYLASHSRQQAELRHAQATIISSKLKECVHTDHIAHVAEELSWVEEFGIQQKDAELQTLFIVSRNVRAASSASNAARRQSELLKQLKELRSLVARIMTASVGTADRYGSTVNSWISILDQAVRTLSYEGLAGEIPPVYIVGPHLQPETAPHLFAGRTDLIREIENAITSPSPPTLLLHGQHRTGKTSLLAFLPARLPTDWLPLLVDVQGISAARSPAGLARELIVVILESARKARNAEFKVLQRPPLEDFRDEPFLSISEWLHKIGRTVPEQQKFLLCFDECERFVDAFDASDNRSLVDILQSVSTSDPRWAILFASSREPSAMIPCWREYLNRGRRVHISYLNREETRRLIEHPTPDFEHHMTYDSGAVEAIIQLTHGQPMLVQLLCSELVDLLNNEKRRTANQADVEAVINVAFQHAGYFEDLWTSLDDSQRAVLRSVARCEPISARRVVDALVEREILEVKGNVVGFQVPLIGRWVLECADKHRFLVDASDQRLKSAA